MKKQVILVSLCLMIPALGSPVEYENCFGAPANNDATIGDNKSEENGIESELNDLNSQGKLQFAFDLFHELKTEVSLGGVLEIFLVKLRGLWMRQRQREIYLST